MVLPVHVGCERAADGDEPRARGHGHEEAERQDETHEGVEADPRGDADRAACDVDVDHVGERQAVEHRPAGVLRSIAVAPTEPASDDPALTGVCEQVVDPAVAGHARRPRRRSEQCGPIR